MASSAGISSSIAETQRGATIAVSYSTSASSDATISDTVTNWPDGSMAAAPTSSGAESTNTVLPARDARSKAGSSTSAAVSRGSST